MVDGYDHDGWKSLNDANCIDAFEHYSNTLKLISKQPLEIITIHPGKKEEYMPKGVNIEDFDGIVWTGSSLNIYDMTSPIKRQIELAKATLDKECNIFGSCWGLQIYVTAAGGTVRKSPNGREMIFARDIKITDNGKNHSMYKNKSNKESKSETKNTSLNISEEVKKSTNLFKFLQALIKLRMKPNISIHNLLRHACKQEHYSDEAAGDLIKAFINHYY